MANNPLRIDDILLSRVGVQFTSVTLAAGTLALDLSSKTVQRFTGATAGQIVKMPDATTLYPEAGNEYLLVNDGTASIAVQDSAAAAIVTLLKGQRLVIRCVDVSSAAGVWSYSVLTKLSDSLAKRSGKGVAASFAGSPLKLAITFTTAMPSVNYSVACMSQTNDVRVFSVESVTTAGFTINSNSSVALTSDVLFEAIEHGEFN